MGDDLVDDATHSKLSIVLFFFATGVMGHIFIYCIVAAIRWCNRRRDLQNPQSLYEIAEMKSSIGNTTVQFISTHKYQKDMELIGDDGTCPVCLSEFEEGEELCSLPKCLHSFHVACINMWLISHPSCPMCRENAMPSPQIFCGVTESSGAIELEIHQEPSMLQGVVVQARPV